MSDWWNQATPPAVEPEATAAATPAACPWCDAPATPAATYCASCGAVMAQRGDLGGLAIPGVTAVAAQSALTSVRPAGAVGGVLTERPAQGRLDPDADDRGSGPPPNPPK